MATARKTKPKAMKARPKQAAPSGRSLWRGQLRLALVNIPVMLMAATDSAARISFHQVDKVSHKRIRYEKTAPGVGAVKAENIVKGFEISKGEYVLLSDEEMDRIKLETRRSIDLVQFVDHCEVDPLYFEKPYFVVPDGQGAEEAYAVLRDALRATGKMGLGQFVMRGREYIAALQPCGQGLMLETLRFADEVRSNVSLFEGIGTGKADPELLELAQDLIRRKAKKFDPAAFQDHYTEALRALIEAKAKHLVPVEEGEADEPARGNVVDLVEALRRSVGGDAPGRKRAAKG